MTKIFGSWNEDNKDMSLRTQNYCIRCIRSENLRDMYSAMIFIASQEERVEESIEVVAGCMQKLLLEPEPENEHWDRTLQAGARAYATLVNRYIKSANDFRYLDSLLDCLQKMVTSRITRPMAGAVAALTFDIPEHATRLLDVLKELEKELIEDPDFEGKWHLRTCIIAIEEKKPPDKARLDTFHP
ncbi:MAG: hypothetical protein ACK5OC_25760 [Pirellula sp.]|jgi:hypothetical protein